MKKYLLVFATILATTITSKAQTVYKTKGGYYACATERTFEKATTYAVQKDYQALQNLLDAGLCIKLRGGVTVYAEEYKFFKGIVEIRPKGQTGTVWTNIEAIEK